MKESAGSMKPSTQIIDFFLIKSSPYHTLKQSHLIFIKNSKIYNIMARPSLIFLALLLVLASTQKSTTLSYLVDYEE